MTNEAEQAAAAQAPPQPAPDMPPAVPAAGAAPGQINPDTRTLVLLTHLSALILGFIGPLIFWLIKRDEDPAIDDQGAEALNFNLSIMIYMMAASVLILAFIGLLLLPLLGLFWMIMVIVAAVKSNNGELFRYPLTIRMVKPKESSVAALAQGFAQPTQQQP